MAEAYTDSPFPQRPSVSTAGRFSADDMDLPEINEILKTLRMKIHMSGIKVAGWESLKVTNDKYKHHKRAEAVARKTCETLQKELKSVMDKVDNHQYFESIYREKKALNQEMSDKQQMLEMELLKQQKKLSDLQKMEMDTQVLTKQNKEQDRKIKNLELQLQKAIAESNRVSEVNRNNVDQLRIKKETLESLANSLETTTATIHSDYEALEYKSLELNSEIEDLKEVQVPALLVVKKEMTQKMVDLSRENEYLHHEYEPLLKKAKALRDELDQTINGKDALERTNNDLKQQIQDLNEQLKCRESFASQVVQLKVQQTVLKEQQQQLIKAHAEAFNRLLRDKDWKSEYDVQKELNDNLQITNIEWKEKINALMNSLTDLDACKANYKAMKAGIKVTVRQNNHLKKQHQALENKFSSEQRYEEKNHAIMLENRIARAENCTLQCQVEERQSTLQGTEALTLIYKGLVLDKKTIKRQKEDLLRELRQLDKNAAEEAPLKQLVEAAEAENKSNRRELVKYQVQLGSVPPQALHSQQFDHQPLNVPCTSVSEQNTQTLTAPVASLHQPTASPVAHGSNAWYHLSKKPR